MGMVESNGIRLSVTEEGDGDPVVLISGTGMPPEQWQLGLAPALVAQGFRVVTFANRGIPPSDCPPAPYTVADMTADTAGVIDALGLGRCRVVGYSMGGCVAQELCRRRPDLVHEVVLIASLGRTSAFMRVFLEAQVALAQALDPQPHVQAISDVLLLTQAPAVLQHDDATVERWLALYQAAPPWTNPGRLGQWSADLAWARDTTLPQRWPQLPQRCLAIAFEHDLAWPPERVREAAAAMPDARFVQVAGAAHGGAVTHHEAVSARVLEFFAESRN
jgi:pimeloyl-ACP methyl ester carboxylesterase